MLIEMRCPLGPQRLFAKMIVSGENVHINSDNLMEFSCGDCTRTLRKQGRDVVRVLHRYNLLAQYVESEVVDRD